MPHNKSRATRPLPPSRLTGAGLMPAQVGPRHSVPPIGGVRGFGDWWIRKASDFSSDNRQPITDNSHFSSLSHHSALSSFCPRISRIPLTGAGRVPAQVGPRHSVPPIGKARSPRGARASRLRSNGGTGSRQRPVRKRRGGRRSPRGEDRPSPQVTDRGTRSLRRGRERRPLDLLPCLSGSRVRPLKLAHLTLETRISLTSPASLAGCVT